jgi:hypothetical protein
MTIADIVSVAAAAMLSVGGAGAIMIGLSKYFGDRLAERWIEGIKAAHAKELARVEHGLAEFGKYTQARLDHAVTVTRAQFDVEFAALREIWKFVARSRAAVVGVVETKVPENDTEEARLQRFFSARAEVGEAQRKLMLAVDNNSPFYPEPVYQAVDAFRTRTKLELSRLETRKPFTSDWFDERNAASGEIIVLAEQVSYSIRQRLGSIVIEDSPAHPLPDVTVVDVPDRPALEGQRQ